MLFEKTETVIIVGCGRLGSNIAGSLSAQGFNVTILDLDEEVFRKLPDAFSGYELVGDGTDIDTLEQIGIREANILLALTESDNINSFIAQIASRIFNVPKVFVRFNDPEKEQIIKDFNINVIYPFRLSISEFERLSNLKVTEVVK